MQWSRFDWAVIAPAPHDPLCERVALPRHTSWALRRLSLMLGVSALVACAPIAGHEALDADVHARAHDSSLVRLDAAQAGDAFSTQVSDAGSALVPEAALPVSNLVSRPGFCAQPGADAVRDVFCAEHLPAVTSLADLQQQLALDPFRASGSTAYYDRDDAGVPIRPVTQVDASVVLNLNVVMLGHSTALSGSLVTPINPRAILMGESTMMAFHRGIQRVELIAPARDRERLNFYLLSFEQACNAPSSHCTPGDLYTARIEADWQRVLVQDDEELKNTSSDCRQCHQRKMESPILLMRELNGPWTHFFAHDRDDVPDVVYPEPSGRDLVRDYRLAKGDEAYAAMSISIVRGTIGLALETRIPFRQPLLFEGTTILNERWPEGGNGAQAAPNRSPTWDRAYEAFKRGEQLALPYFATRPTDPGKLAALSDAYRRYRSGSLRAEELPDLSDIYPDDPRTRAEIGLQTEPGATPAQALVQACGSCHNDVLDQTITRAHFSIDLSRMSLAEREQAIARIERPTDSMGAMPPPETRQLDPEVRAKLAAYLRLATRTAEDDALLSRAAALGMAVVPPRVSVLPPSPY
ncbi:MAG: hypothetical protein RLZZ450_2490 [Pseudomonadota bacterium]